MENEMLDFVKALSHADRLRIIGALSTRKGDGSQYWRPASPSSERNDAQSRNE